MFYSITCPADEVLCSRICSVVRILLFCKNIATNFIVIYK